MGRFTETKEQELSKKIKKNNEIIKKNEEEMIFIKENQTNYTNQIIQIETNIKTLKEQINDFDKRTFKLEKSKISKIKNFLIFIVTLGIKNKNQEIDDQLYNLSIDITTNKKKLSAEETELENLKSKQKENENNEKQLLLKQNEKLIEQIKLQNENIVLLRNKNILTAEAMSNLNGKTKVESTQSETEFWTYNQAYSKNIFDAKTINNLNYEKTQLEKLQNQKNPKNTKLLTSTEQHIKGDSELNPQNWPKTLRTSTKEVSSSKKSMKV